MLWFWNRDKQGGAFLREGLFLVNTHDFYENFSNKFWTPPKYILDTLASLGGPDETFPKYYP